MSLTLELDCCGPDSPSVREQLMGWISCDDLSPVALAQASLLDCSTCQRTEPGCVSSLCEPVRFCSLLPTAVRLKPGSAELVAHKLESDGLWLPLASVAAALPLTVAPLVASAVTVPELTLAKAQNWPVIVNLAKAGVLKTDLTREIQSWQPMSCVDIEHKRELLNYFGWRRGSSHVSSVLVLRAICHALKPLPAEIVSFIVSLTGLVVTD